MAMVKGWAKFLDLWQASEFENSVEVRAFGVTLKPNQFSTGIVVSDLPVERLEEFVTLVEKYHGKWYDDTTFQAMNI